MSVLSCTEIVLARSRARIRVVVIAVGKICAVLEEKAKARVSKLIVIAVEIVSAKLVDGDDYDKFGTPVIR